MAVAVRLGLGGGEKEKGFHGGGNPYGYGPSRQGKLGWMRMRRWDDRNEAPLKHKLLVLVTTRDGLRSHLLG